VDATGARTLGECYQVSGVYRFTVLGPVRAWRGTQEVELGSPQQRTVLAALLVREGGLATIGELIDAVWGAGDIPGSAEQAVRTYVHRLRRVLGPGRKAADSIIASVGKGYLLRTKPQMLDLGDFRRCLNAAGAARAQADPAGALQHLREGLALWQGPALTGIAGEYAELHRVKLGKLRLDAIEARIRAEFELGSFVEAATELPGLIADLPFDERFRELLMLALYRSGRQAEALAIYRQARALFANELGVEPGPGLRNLHERILRADPRLSPVQVAIPEGATELLPPPAQLPADRCGFTGRKDELARAESLVSAGEDRAVVALVTGMAGVGKTTFAVHCAHRVAGRFPDGQLYLNLRGFDPFRPAVSAVDALHTVLEALGVPSQDIPQDLDGRMSLYERSLAGRRVLIVLDNVHDADQVRPLLASVPGCLFIVTSRDRLCGLVGREDAGLFALDVPSQADATGYLVRHLGARRVLAARREVKEIIEHCGRLPLAMAIVGARAALNPDLPLEAILADLRDSQGRLDAFSDVDSAADVRAVFSWSYRSLTADAALLFRMLSVPPWTSSNLTAAASLAGLSITQARRAVAELISVHLLSEPTPGRYTYHDLVRAYAVEQAESTHSPEERREALRRGLDHLVCTADVVSTLLNPHRSSLELVALRPGTTIDDVSDHHTSAWTWFTAQHDGLVAAVQGAYHAGFDKHAWQLASSLETFLQRDGDWQDRIRTQQVALAAAERLGDRCLQARAHSSLGNAYTGIGQLALARHHLDRAVEAFQVVGSDVEKSKAHVSLGNLFSSEGRSQDAIRHFREALRLSTDPVARAIAVNNLSNEYSVLGSHQRAITLCLQAITLWTAVGDPHGAAGSWGSLGYTYHQLGHHAEAASCYSRAIRTFRDLGDRYNEATTLVKYGDNRLAVNDTSAARNAWQRAVDLLTPPQHPSAEQVRVKLAELAS
jgi:DNA-binding SARP family transcriptional activator/predicted negative regulator of RcsB-dependent stress response